MQVLIIGVDMIMPWEMKVKISRFHIYKMWRKGVGHKSFYPIPAPYFHVTTYELPYRVFIGFFWLIWDIFIEIHYKK